MDDNARHFLTIGQRDKAFAALQACPAREDSDDATRAALAALEHQLRPTAVREIRVPEVAYAGVLFAKTVITIGRQQDNDIPIVNTDISRYHARFEVREHACVVEDLGSRNGTRSNGLRIQRQAVVHPRDTIGFGAHTDFEVTLRERSTGRSIILTPRVDAVGLAHRYILFSEAMFIGADAECELPLDPAAMPAPLPHLFKIVYRAPYWFVYIHPHARQVEFNGVPVNDYVTVTAGDVIAVAGFPFVFA